jgi:hypothetical protein
MAIFARRRPRRGSSLCLRKWSPATQLVAEPSDYSNLTDSNAVALVDININLDDFGVNIFNGDVDVGIIRLLNIIDYDDLDHISFLFIVIFLRAPLSHDQAPCLIVTTTPAVVRITMPAAASFAKRSEV